MANYAGTPGNDIIDAGKQGIPDWTDIVAGAGDDVVIAGLHKVELGAGNDQLTGTVHTTLRYWDSPAGVRVDFVAGSAQDGHGGTDTFSGIVNVMGSGHDDYFKAAASTRSIWAMGGHDTIEGLQPFAAVTIQTTAGAAPVFTRAGDGWKVSYSTHGNNHSVTLDGPALIKEWIDASSWRTWDLSGATPVALPAPGAVFEPVAGATDGKWWTLGQWNVASVSLTERHDAWYYPTVHDYNPPGVFSADAHNAARADFNGDGLQDMVVSWVLFPHTVERDTDLMPSVLINKGGSLEAVPASATPSSLLRHMNYRTLTGDFNGDGIDDFGSAGMGVIQRDPASGGMINRWEPVQVALSNGNGTFLDGSAGLEGQTLTQPSPVATFGHDFSVGDVNGDRIDDIYTGGRLWLSTGGGQFRDASAALHAATGLPGNPMASAMGDLDGNGTDDIVSLYPDFGSNRLVAFSSGGSDPGFRVVPLPAGLFGTNTKDNFVITADVNRDGLLDIVAAETRAEPYYAGAALQIMVQVAPGVFEDQTASRIDNSSRDGVQGEGSLSFIDANGDGHPDLIHSNSNSNDGIAIFLNDGAGHFTLLDRTQIPFLQRWQLNGWQEAGAELHGQHIGNRGYPMHIDDDGIIDFVVQIDRPFTAWPQVEPSVMSLYTLVSAGSAFGRDLGETLAGSGLADRIYGLGGDDRISAGAGDDWLDGGAGNDTLDGGAGFDIARYQGERAGYVVRKEGSGIAVSGAGVDALQSIERIMFDDGALALDIDGAGGQVYRVYQAVFDRPADEAGLGYWMAQMDRGVSLKAVAQAFMQSGEFLAMYGAAPTPETFVGKLYHNVLHRAPEQAGYEFWVNALKLGVSQEDVLVEFSESAENQLQVIGLIENGIPFIPFGGG